MDTPVASVETNSALTKKSSDASKISSSMIEKLIEKLISVGEKVKSSESSMKSLGAV